MREDKKFARHRFNRLQRMRSFPPEALGWLCDRRLPDAGAVNPQGGDAAPIHGYYFHLAARYRDAVAHPRQSTELGERIATECGPITVGYGDPIIGTHVDKRKRSRELQYTIGHHRLARCKVVLVRDVADDLLNQVLHRHDTSGAPVFVEHYRHVCAGAA